MADESFLVNRVMTSFRNTTTKNPLVISFTGSGGVNNFKSILFKNFRCHSIFLNDFNKRWYLNGIPGLGSTVDEVVKSLKQLISTFNYSKLIILGISAGGYAALLFGSLLGADTILSFCPQTLLIDSVDLMGTNLIERIRDLIISNTSEYSNYYDILKLDNSKINKIVIIYGNILKPQYPDDIKMAERMRVWNNVNIKIYPFDHTIAICLKESGVLLEILKEYIV
jgi:hypothetical protein